MTTRSRLHDLGWSLLLGSVVLGPLLLHRGFALRGDMVFVPHQPWKPAWLGLDGSVGRAVPVDALVSLTTHLVPGDLLQKAVLLLTLVTAGVGAARLVGDRPFAARAAAATVFVWNPWVHERLAIGQWGTVTGYALLPWVALAASRFRDDLRAGWPVLTVGLGVCALATPSAALLGGLAALVVVLTRPRVPTLLVLLGTLLLVNLPWIVPSLLTSARAAGGGQFQAFSARGESGIGVVASVLSLGGIWKTSVVPPERKVAAIVGLSLLLTVAAVATLLVRRLRHDLPPGLGWLAGLSVVLAATPSVPLVARGLDVASTHVVAVGMLRDSQRFLAPAALLLAYGVAVLVGWLWEGAAFDGRRPLAVLALAWPVLCLPSLAWGLHGAFDPVTYPPDWQGVASLAAQHPEPTVVLPWRGGYRGFSWNHRHASLDPAPRFFAGDMLIDDRVVLDDRVLGSEDPVLRSVDTALQATDPAAALRRLGVRRLLVEKGNGVRPVDIPAGQVVYDGPQLRLVELGGAGDLARSRPKMSVVVAGDAAATITFVLGVLLTTRRFVYSVRQPGDRRRPGLPGRNQI